MSFRLGVWVFVVMKMHTNGLFFPDELCTECRREYFNFLAMDTWISLPSNAVESAIKIKHVPFSEMFHVLGLRAIDVCSPDMSDFPWCCNTGANIMTYRRRPWD